MILKILRGHSDIVFGAAKLICTLKEDDFLMPLAAQLYYIFTSTTALDVTKSVAILEMLCR